MKKQLEAIKRLRPDCTFILIGNDIENIEWVSPADTITPTTEEISAEIEKMDAEPIQFEVAKSALLAKLGITEDEARLLLGGN